MTRIFFRSQEISVGGGGNGNVVSMTQAQYDALATKDANTIYVVEGVGDAKLLACDGDGELWNINPDDPDDESGDFGSLGTLNIPGTRNPIWHTMGMHNGELYGIMRGSDTTEQNPTTLKLVKIDPNNLGNSSTVVDLNNAGIISGLASIGGGLYIFDPSNLKLRLVDLGTGNITDIGTVLDLSQNDLEGVGNSGYGIEFINGDLYLILTRDNPTLTQLFKVNYNNPSQTTDGYGALGTLPFPNNVIQPAGNSLAWHNDSLYTYATYFSNSWVRQLFRINLNNPADDSTGFGLIGAVTGGNLSGLTNYVPITTRIFLGTHEIQLETS